MSSGWSSVGILFIGIAISAALFGLLAGRNLHVNAKSLPL